MPRIPELAIFAVLQSIMFVLLFAFVFGGAIPLPGGRQLPRVPDARDLRPDDRVRGRDTTAIGMGEDMHKGLIDRFRSLPMARSAVLVGRTLVRRRLQRRDPGRADALGARRRLARQQRPPGRSSTASACCSCSPSRCPGSASGSACRCRSVEVAQQARLHRPLPAHLRVERVRPGPDAAGWLQPIAEWNPVSTLTASLRDLLGNPNPFTSTGIPAQHPILVTLALDRHHRSPSSPRSASGATAR